MAEKLLVELQDDKGNIFYLHTSSAAVFCADGKTVQEKIGTVKGRITTKENLKLVTEANYLPEAKAVKDYFDELNGKLLRARNTSQTGWTFNRMGNLVFFSHNKVVGGVVANTKYTNQGNAPAGYKPVAKYYANGIRMVGSVINGSFYFEILPDGSTVFESTANHTNDQSYVVSGCYITDDTFPTADKL